MTSKYDSDFVFSRSETVETKSDLNQENHIFSHVVVNQILSKTTQYYEPVRVRLHVHHLISALLYVSMYVS